MSAENAAWHCHECHWSAFDLTAGVEVATAEASKHHGFGHDVYRCDTRHVA